MKKFFVLLFIIVSFTAFLKSTVPYISVSVQAEPCYARVKYNNVLLYKNPKENNSFDNIFCLLEPTYFVKVIKDENQLFFKVEYLSLTGYALKSQLECVFEQPQKPYPNATFNTTNFSSVVLRNSPEVNESNVLQILPPNSTLNYYGKITGQTATEDLGNLWFYCSFETIEGQKINGYIYEPLTHNFTPILENIEVTTISEFGASSKINTFLNIKQEFHIALILITVLPLIFILILFLKRTKVINN